jgi:6-phosphofructokinase 1
MEYTRDLGYCAAEYLASGEGSSMISIQGGRFVPIPFDTMIDPETGRTRVRSVDISSTRYAIARRYMLRLKQEDFDDPHDLAKLAATAHLELEEFRARFAYLTAHEPASTVSVAGASKPSRS